MQFKLFTPFKEWEQVRKEIRRKSENLLFIIDLNE